jgi:hypothetical protein
MTKLGQTKPTSNLLVIATVASQYQKPYTRFLPGGATGYEVFLAAKQGPFDVGNVIMLMPSRSPQTSTNPPR